MVNQHPASQPEKALGPTKKIAWGMGACADTLMANSIGYLGSKIYTIGLGVDPAFLGMCMSVPPVICACLNPIIGNISDNTRGRFGRRRPYIFIGAILCAFMFYLLWSPPTGLSKNGLMTFFLIVSVFYYMAYSLFAIPWVALGYELTNDYHERTRVQSYRIFIAAVAGISLGGMWWLSFKLGNGNDIVGLPRVALLCAIFIALAGVVPAFFGQEKAATQHQKKIGFFSAVMQTFENKVFWLLSLIVLLFMVGLFLVQPLGGFINVYYVFGGDKQALSKLDFWANMTFQVMGFLLIPVISWVSRKIGKKQTMLVGLAMVTLGFLCSWFLYSPAHPYLQFVFFAMISPGISCIWILSGSMIADLCDLDELKSGLRREGMYGAVFAWLCKASAAAIGIISGYVIKWSGYNEGLTTQSDQTLLNLRLVYMLVPVGFFVVAFVLTLFYPVTEKRLRDIRTQLESRVPPSPSTGSTTGEAVIT